MNAPLKVTLFVRPNPVLLGNGVLGNGAFSGAPRGGMKSNMYQFVALREELRRHGLELATQHIHPFQDLVLVLDQVDYFKDCARPIGQALCLMLSEPPIYYPSNWNPVRYTVSDRVLTYDVRMVDNMRYFRYHYAIDLEAYPPFQPVSEAEFALHKLCIIAAASFGVIALPAGSPSLLCERFSTLKRFAEHYVNAFDSFSRGVHPDTYTSFRGAGLLKRCPSGVVLRPIARRRQRIFERVYRSSIPALEKIEYVRRYKFAIAHENTKGPNGYLTEKLFDFLTAVNVPVYLGDRLSADIVPPNCCIDRRQFATHEESYRYLVEMPYARYAKYVAVMQEFIRRAPKGILSTAYSPRLLAAALLGALPAAAAPAAFSSPTTTLSHHG